MTRTADTAAAPVAQRGIRALFFGLTVLLLAAGAHVVAGGGLPGLPILLAVGVPVACASVVLARRIRSMPALVVALGLAQFALHEIFASAGSATCVPAHGGSGVHHGGAHHAVAASCEAMPAMAAHATPSVLMVALHLVATVVTAALLAHGERLLTRLSTWARDLVRPARLPWVPTRPLVAIRACSVERPARWLHGDDLSRRGPPASTAFVFPVTA